jgi:hypothetical protein
MAAVAAGVWLAPCGPVRPALILLVLVMSASAAGNKTGTVMKPPRGSHAERLHGVIAHPSIAPAMPMDLRQRRRYDRMNLRYMKQGGARPSRDAGVRRDAERALETLWPTLKGMGLSRKPRLAVMSRAQTQALFAGPIIVGHGEVHLARLVARAVALAPPGDTTQLLKNLAYVAYGGKVARQKLAGKVDRARYREAVDAALAVILAHEIAHKTAHAEIDMTSPARALPLIEAPGLAKRLVRAFGKREAAALNVGVLKGDGTLEAAPHLDALKMQAKEHDADQVAAKILASLPGERGRLQGATAFYVITAMHDHLLPGGWQPDSSHPKGQRRLDDFLRAMRLYGVDEIAPGVTRPAIMKALREVHAEIHVDRPTSGVVEPTTPATRLQRVE